MTDAAMELSSPLTGVADRLILRAMETAADEPDQVDRGIVLQLQKSWPARADAAPRTAFDALYERHAQRLMAYLLTQLSQSRFLGAADAPRLHDSVWTRVANYLPRFKLKTGYSFRSWLFSLADDRLDDALIECFQKEHEKQEEQKQAEGRITQPQKRGTSATHAVFAELHARHDSRLQAFVGRKCFNSDDVTEVCQEVWLRVYRALDRYKPRASFRVWWKRIAVNCLINRESESVLPSRTLAS